MVRSQSVRTYVRNAVVALVALIAVTWLTIASAPSTPEASASRISGALPQAPLALDKLAPLVPPVFGPNVRANSDNTQYGQHEPSLAVSRTDNDVVVVAAKDYRNGNVKQVWIDVSTDGGVTWPVTRQLQIPGIPAAQYPIQSDPVVMARDDGRIYVACLATNGSQNSGGVFITWTDDNGATWRNPSVAIAQNDPFLDDKDWFAIDNNPASPYYHRIYMMYAPAADYVAEQHSTDGGLTWSPRRQIGSSGTEYTYPVIAGDGTVYNFMMLNWGFCNTGTVQMTKSTDGGVSWSIPSTVATAEQPCSPIRSSDQFRFFSIISAGVDPISQGPNHTLYVSWTDDRTFNTTGTDVLYVKSTDGGATWSQPINLAQAAGRPECPTCDNITPMVTVGQDGKVHAFWLDRANNPPPPGTGNGFFDSFYTSSTDGGATWDQATSVSTESQNLNLGFPPGSGNAAGDYWGLDVSGDSVYVAWNDTRYNQQQDILVSRGIMGVATATPTQPASTATATAAPSYTPTSVPPSSTATSQVTTTPTATGTATATPIAECQPEWQVVDQPAPSQVDDIAALGDNTAWAVTTDTIHYWNGATWEVKAHLTPSPMPTAYPTLEFYSLRALSAYEANDVWAVGMHGDSGGNIFGLVMHWNGTTWSVISQWAGPPEDPQGGTLRYLYDVQALGPNSAIAVGGSYFGGPPIILRCTAATGCTSDFPPHANGPYNSVSASSPNDIWVVGGSGISIIAHYNGTAWQQVPSPNIGTLRSVVATAPNDAWAVGDGTLLRWDGTAWTQFAGGPAQAYSLTASGPNDVWLAANTNGVWRWNGSTWTQSLSMTAHLFSVSAAAPDNVWTSGTGTAHYAVPQQFTDVQPNNTFYPYVQTLACRNIIQGYPCGGPGEPCDPENRPYFRPNAGITRGQLSKVVSLAAGFSEPVPSTQQTFTDVPYGSAFWEYVERMASREIVQGYPCGGPGEPCDPQSRPYFRPNNPTTRGQISKVVAIAAGYTQTPTTQTFADVEPGSTFYVWVENLAQRGIMAGYACGGPGEPCDPQNRPYFRPNNPATRGQVSKIVANTFFPSGSARPERPAPGR